LLAGNSSAGAVLARVVALRSKGLILRDNYDRLEEAVKGHQEAVQMLEPLCADAATKQRAQMETVLNLAE